MAIKIKKPVEDNKGNDNVNNGSERFIFIIIGIIFLFAFIATIVEYLLEYFAYGRGDWLINGLFVFGLLIIKLVVTYFLYKYYYPFAKKIYPIVLDFYTQKLTKQHELIILCCTWVTLLIFPTIILLIVWTKF